MKILKVILIIMETVQPPAQFCWKTLSKSLVWGSYPWSDKAGKNTYCPARKAYWSMQVRSVRKVKKTQQSCDKLLIDWVRSGWTGKYLVLLGRTDLEPNIFPSGSPTQSISTDGVPWTGNPKSPNLFVNCLWECACFDSGTPWPSSLTYFYSSY